MLQPTYTQRYTEAKQHNRTKCESDVDNEDICCPGYASTRLMSQYKVMYCSAEVKLRGSNEVQGVYILIGSKGPTRRGNDGKEIIAAWGKIYGEKGIDGMRQCLKAVRPEGEGGP